jgi:pyrroloquinoline quinone biosynthesis protein D
MSEARTRAIAAANSVPRLARGIKLQFDTARSQWILLAPERIFVPDETATEILRLVDGAATIDRIVDALAEKYQAPRAEIAADVIAMVQDLADKGCVNL